MANKQTSMPPPGAKPKGGLVIAVGVGKPKDAVGQGQAEDAGKMSTDEALVIRSDHHCKDCQHYDPASGDCEKVEGSFDPEDACLRWYTPMGGGDEPDADEQGGPPDSDADDSPSMPYGRQ